MNLTCRLLSQQDQSAVHDLWITKRTIFKMSLPEGYPERLEKRLERIFSDQTPKIYLFGVFRESDLIATWAVWPWQTLPYYSLNELVLRNEDSSPTLYKNVINRFLETIFPMMESQGRFQFYILTLLRPYQRTALVEKHQWDVPEDMTPYERYDMTVEAIVPKNEKPQYSIYWGLMGEKLWACDLWVRRGCLKKEFSVPALLKKSKIME